MDFVFRVRVPVNPIRVVRRKALAVLILLVMLLSARASTALPAELLIDNGDGTITDAVSGLMWLKDANYYGWMITWDSAMDWADSLVFAGYDDWRLPRWWETKDMYYRVMGGVLDEGIADPGPFVNLQSGPWGLYWESEAVGVFNRGAFDFNTGRGELTSKASTLWVWPVRDALEIARALESGWLLNPVTLDGQISSPEEWADTIAYRIPLDRVWGWPDRPVEPNAKMLIARFKNDDVWLYMLYQIQWRSATTDPADEAIIELFWGTYGPPWEYSDAGLLSFGQETCDAYGWDDTSWYLDTEAVPPGQNNVEGAASHEGAFYCFEFRKRLNSGDGRDWSLSPGELVGNLDGPPNLLVALRSSSISLTYEQQISLQLSGAYFPYIDFQGTIWAREGSGPTGPWPYDSWYRFLYMEDGESNAVAFDAPSLDGVSPSRVNAVIEDLVLSCAESVCANFYVDGRPSSTSKYIGGSLTIYLDNSPIITVEDMTLVLTSDFDTREIHGYGWATLTGVLEDGGIGIYEDFTQFSESVLIMDICSTYPAAWSDPFQYDITFRFTVPGDNDGDDIFNELDTQPYVFSNEFSDVKLGGTTTGTITDRGDQILTVAEEPNYEEPNPAGVRVIADPSVVGAPATVVLENAEIHYFDAGDEMVLTVNSVTVEMVRGMVEITFFTDDATPATTSLSEANSMTFDPTTFTFTAPSTNLDTIVALIEGEPFEVSPGETVTVDIIRDIILPEIKDEIIATGGKLDDKLTDLKIQTEGAIKTATDTLARAITDAKTAVIAEIDAIEEKLDKLIAKQELKVELVKATVEDDDDNKGRRYFMLTTLAGERVDPTKVTIYIGDKELDPADYTITKIIDGTYDTKIALKTIPPRKASSLVVEAEYTDPASGTTYTGSDILPISRGEAD